MAEIKDRTFGVKIRMNSQLNESLQEFKELYEENEGVELKKDREVLEALLEVALSRFAPYKDQKQKISKLEAENKQLKEKLANCSNVSDKYQHLDKEFSQLKNELEQKTKQLEKCIMSLDDLNELHKSLLQRYKKSEKLKKILKKESKNGVFRDFYPEIDQEDVKKSYKNIFLSSFILSAQGKPLPAVTSNKNIRKAMERLTKNIDL